MNNPAHPHDDPLAGASREEIMAALFANMVIQQTNMAMMFLGKTPHPETGQVIKDLEAAKMFIDQLEMLEAKTKGNLSKQEDGLLKQALAALHMTFVEAVDGHGETPSSEPAQPAPSQAAPAEPQPSTASPGTDAAPAAEESRKKFTKKY
jgi:hypothetical protein